MDDIEQVLIRNLVAGRHGWCGDKNYLWLVDVGQFFDLRDIMITFGTAFLDFVQNDIEKFVIRYTCVVAPTWIWQQDSVSTFCKYTEDRFDVFSRTIVQK